MQKVINKFYCDVCKKEIDKNFLDSLWYKNDDGTIKISVIFITEQTEGRHCKPYVYVDRLHICEKCYNKIINDGKQIFGAGAMGYNNYWFKE